MANNKYVMASDAGNGSLIAKAESIDTWEKFHMINHDDGTTSFKALINAKHVTAEFWGIGPLAATRYNLDDWEKFYIEYH